MSIIHVTQAGFLSAAQSTWLICTMFNFKSSHPAVVKGICDPNKSGARHHHSLKLGSKLKYLTIDSDLCCKVANLGTVNLPNL